MPKIKKVRNKRTKSSNNNIALLKNIPLFETLKYSSLKNLLNLFTKEHFRKGKKIITEDEMGNSLYIILKGEVEVVKGKPNKRVALLKPFDFFGEMSLLENKPRSASVIAKTNTELLKLSKKDFEQMVTKHPKISFEIMKTLSARIRETDLKLIEDLKNKNKELKRAYRDLKKVQKELINAEKLSTIGKIAGGIIHDLKNPLSIVKGFAEYIKQSKDVPKSIITAATTIIREINIILNMTQEVLEFSKGEYKLETIPLNIDKFITETVNVAVNEFQKKNVRLNLKLKAKCELIIDPQKMRRVFLNIISNAYDAMKEGGTLTISAIKKPKYVQVTFQDTGCGLDKESLKNIYEPFFTKGKRKGTGLGMSIAKRIIEEHKGKISVSSRLGEGTTVVINLPIL
ncbi:MAG: hypothetical protein B5M53_03340 [Candidatus Cloacimonas sp. 4484_209]|nr:MAG: hypothetical protein B5M53_03340 [Candidatus Cloacimonas sp. 4484_209]